MAFGRNIYNKNSDWPCPAVFTSQGPLMHELYYIAGSWEAVFIPNYNTEQGAAVNRGKSGGDHISL